MARITVCGAGNAAHTLIPLLAADGHHAVTVFAPLADEAARWQRLLDDGGTVTLRFADGQQVVGQPDQVTADAGAAAAGADLVLLALPAFAHEAILRSMAPHLPSTSAVGALPARGGFDWLARAVLPTHQGPIFGLQTLPWACRIRQWGREVEVLGIKHEVDLAVTPGVLMQEVARELEVLLGVTLRVISGFLALTLANTGQLIHPGIMYGLFHAWNGQPIGEDQVPLFYGGTDRYTSGVLQGLSDDVQTVRASLQGLVPHVDLSSVEPLDAWLRRSYGGQIEDASTLQSSLNTNTAYTGLRAPVRPIEKSGQGMVEPWFTHRYLSEDVPFGLLVTRGIAELAGVDMPVVDQVLAWAQQKLGKAYLVAGRVAGRDVTESRAPQRFGMRTLEALLEVA